MTTPHLRTAILVPLLAALAGCACDTVPAGAVTDCDAQVVPGGAATDILFVIDDSGSMREEQQALADNLGEFIDALVNAPVRLDVRIGVTNTSIHNFSGGEAYGATSGGVPFPGPPGTPYPKGALVATDGTPGHFLWGAQYDDPSFATSTWGGPRILADGPSLARDFKANVLQGVWGSGKEQPLEAMRRALEQARCPAGLNCGFQRAGARLAVVVVTDEDDCSSDAGTLANDPECHATPPPPELYPLADYVAYLDSTAFSDAGPPVFALIAGFDPQGNTSTCHGMDPVFVPTSSTQAFAVPTRLAAFVDQLEAPPTPPAARTRTLKRSICGRFGPALLDIASMIIPQTVTLDEAPADWRMLAVSLDRGGATVPCRLALAGADDESRADAVFTPSQQGAPATITFQRSCQLGVGDRIDIRIVCAR